MCDLHIRRCRYDPDHMLCENEFAEHERECRPLCTIWRIHIKPTAKEGVDPRAFCLENSILGVGWLVEAKTKPDWENISRIGIEAISERQRLASRIECHKENACQ